MRESSTIVGPDENQIGFQLTTHPHDLLPGRADCDVDAYRPRARLTCLASSRLEYRATSVEHIGARRGAEGGARDVRENVEQMDLTAGEALHDRNCRLRDTCVGGGAVEGSKGDETSVGV
jgi:hypothetical protein